jgi:hypothetical protein
VTTLISIIFGGGWILVRKRESRGTNIVYGKRMKNLSIFMKLKKLEKEFNYYFLITFWSGGVNV